MNFNNDFTNGLIGLLASKGIQWWMSTLDYRALFYDRSVDPVNGPEGPGIYVFWHENILCPLYLRRHSNLSMLLSRHRDADILAVIARLNGFGAVRGSTGRGGREALEQLIERSHTQHITITPDGPRGPRRQMAFGPIYLASRTGLPIIAIGFGYDRPWRVDSWDRFAVPRPFSRARVIGSPRVYVPRGVEREEMESYRLSVEKLLTQLTEEAGAWAESGKRRRDEEVMRAEFAPRLTPIAAAPPRARSAARGHAA
jgi:lysophospholipid acyltransferase (LPLAT)-like uncharacterized protein